MAYIYLLIHKTQEKFKIEKTYNVDQSYALLKRYYREYDYKVSYELECGELIIDRIYELLHFLFENMHVVENINDNGDRQYFDISCLNDLLEEINSVIAYRKQDDILLNKSISIPKNEMRNFVTPIKYEVPDSDNSWEDVEKFNNITLQELYEWLDGFESDIAGIWRYEDNKYLVLNNSNDVLKDKKYNIIPYSCLKLPNHSWDIFKGGFYSHKVPQVFLHINQEKYQYLANLCQAGQCFSPSLRVISNILNRLIDQSTELDTLSQELKKNYLASIKKEEAFWEKMYGDIIQ